MPLNTELPKQTRQNATLDTVSDPINKNKDIILSTIKVLTNAVFTMKDQLNKKIKCPIISKVKNVFFKWEDDDLPDLIAMGTDSGRCYGKKDVLLDEYHKLKLSFLSKTWPKNIKETDKWLYVCQHENFYLGCENIVHFALCCFSKSPVESIVESVGSTINYHGNKSRASMNHQTLNDEVNIVWNGPEEF